MKLQVSSLLGKRMLILGEAGTGKTQLTTQLLRAFTTKYPKERGIVIDMAPPAMPMGKKTLGGRMNSLNSIPANIQFLVPTTIVPPRLRGTTAVEVQSLAEGNRAAIEPLLEHYLQNPTPLLIINDLTIYLHAGSIKRLLGVIQRAKTMIANAYYGEYLREDRGSQISARERTAMDELLPILDYVIRLPSDKAKFEEIS